MNSLQTLKSCRPIFYSPIEITTIKANFLIVTLLAFFIFGLGMDLGMVQKVDRLAYQN